MIKDEDDDGPTDAEVYTVGKTDEAAADVGDGDDDHDDGDNDADAFDDDGSDDGDGDAGNEDPHKERGRWATGLGSWGSEGNTLTARGCDWAIRLCGCMVYPCRV